MTMFYHHQSQMRDRERRRKESEEREQDSDNHNWTIHGPDPEGVKVPEYLTIARNHLANRDHIVLPKKSKPEKIKKEESEGFNFITILAFAVLVSIEITAVLILWKYFL